jgi:hypothetical protein
VKKPTAIVCRNAQGRYQAPLHDRAAAHDQRSARKKPSRAGIRQKEPPPNASPDGSIVLGPQS